MRSLGSRSSAPAPWSTSCGPPNPAALAETNARALASYPLVPFSNRIDHGGFRLDGQDYRLNRNFLPEPHAIHGDGWQLPGRSRMRRPTARPCPIAMTVPMPAGAGWPFRYLARQRFTVDPDGLTVEIGATNLEARAWPFGCGPASLFPRDAGRCT
ncbi:MAG: hypothetical protein WDO24_25130 [Pseudomonadota bacterium]